MEYLQGHFEKSKKLKYCNQTMVAVFFVDKYNKGEYLCILRTQIHQPVMQQ